MPDAARAILTDARDSYDGACEAVAWSAAVFVLGAWWPPALLGGLLLALVAWRWLRRSVTGLCDAAEAAARVYDGQLTQGAAATPQAAAATPQAAAATPQAAAATPQAAAATPQAAAATPQAAAATPQAAAATPQAAAATPPADRD